MKKYLITLSLVVCLCSSPSHGGIGGWLGDTIGSIGNGPGYAPEPMSPLGKLGCACAIAASVAFTVINIHIEREDKARTTREHQDGHRRLIATTEVLGEEGIAPPIHFEPVEFGVRMGLKEATLSEIESSFRPKLQRFLKQHEWADPYVLELREGPISRSKNDTFYIRYRLVPPAGEITEQNSISFVVVGSRGRRITKEMFGNGQVYLFRIAGGDND